MMQGANTTYRPGYTIDEEREAIESLSGIKSFLMKGRMFTDRTFAEDMTVEDVILSELAIAADLVAPYEENLKTKHKPGDRIIYIRRNIRILNYEEVLETVRIKTGQAHDALSLRVTAILKQGAIADIFGDMQEKYNTLTGSKADSSKDIENLARYLEEASQDILSGISPQLRFLEDKYQKLKSLQERGLAFYQAMENQGGLAHVEQPPKKPWAWNVTQQISKLSAVMPFLKHGDDVQDNGNKPH